MCKKAENLTKSQTISTLRLAVSELKKKEHRKIKKKGGRRAHISKPSKKKKRKAEGRQHTAKTQIIFKIPCQ